jgi:replication factor C subunit 2/4
MRQAINNLQSTYSGFGFVSEENVFKVVDQPHPEVIRGILKDCIAPNASHLDDAMAKLHALWKQGYSAVDVVVTLFRVVKTYDA